MNENTIFEQQNNGEARFLAAFSESRAVKRTAWAIALPSVLFFVASEFWVQAAVAVCGRLGISSDKVIEFIRDPGTLQIIQIILALLLFSFPYIISAKIAGLSVSRDTGLCKPKKGTVLPYFLFGVGFCAFANIAVSLAGRVFESLGFHDSVPQEEDPAGLFGFLLVFISTVIVPGVIEEFAYRGIVIGLLKPFGEGFAIFASATAFGILHGNFDQIPFAFLVGLVLGFVRIKTGSIAVTMAVHAVNNAVAVTLSYLVSVPAAITNLLYTVYIMAALTAAVLGVIMVKKDSFKLKKPDTVNTTKRICVEYFYNPGTLIFYALFLFRACEYIFK